MTQKKGNSLLETRRKNRVLIKNMIFRTEYATRTAIADELGLTLPTITTSVNEMISEGILEDIPMPERELTNNTGRRPNAIAFKGDAAFAIGVELGPFATRSVLINLKGEVIASFESEIAKDNYNDLLDQLISIYKKLKKNADKERLIGFGIGLPGFIEKENGIIRSNPRKDWIGRELVKDLEKHIDIPVLIDNNVRLRAIGHEMSIRGAKPDSFAYFFVANGVACPIMVKEDVVSGYTAGAGEVGHMVVCIDSDGNEKIVDDLGSGRAICDECKKLVKAGGFQELKQIIENQGYSSFYEIVDMQKNGNSSIDKIINRAINYLGIALANVVNLVNPGYVVVDSYLFTNLENRKKLLQAAKTKFYGLNEEEVQIVFSDYDKCRGANGAAFLVIRDLFLNK